MFVKVCGLKHESEIDAAADYGYSAVGIVLHNRSPRFCDFERAMTLAEYAREKIKTVAVGLKYSEVMKVEPVFDYIQVYENCTSEKLILAGESEPKEGNFKYYLFDRSRGSGEFADLPDWLCKYSDRLVISGGLNSKNVRDIIRRFRCAGLDVSSGVEKVRGIKDILMMKEFIEEVKDETGKRILR